MDSNENADDDAAADPAAWWRRPGRAIVAAGRWIADTFRGYSGVREIENRRR
ncbi:hypothetical protein [Halopenitus persicus]|uniref:Uncharacterized protein n=1 Tax=Halopenitus persicus TaxID=1048396 RepID=A0A1H3FJR7_9EURY|nr:hypothetical protein [Halopenitus persicus]QHS16675.1 hypothetical protein GWK26_05660 [haloarchaeon 3A1-DGR]SDX91037.1 hypothetical protein SAMN05216564_10281 [Halopenitus persicus]